MNISGVNFTGGFIVTPAVDPQFNYVTALLHGDGASAGQNNTFLDSSTNNFAITRTGNVTQGSYSPYGSNWSNFFGTTTSNFKFASSASFAIGTGNFTIQCSVNFTAWAGTNQRIVLQGVSGTSNIEISRDSGANELFVNIQNSRIITYAWVPNIGQWYDIALVRSGTGTNQVVLYIDGVSVATGTSSASIAQNQFIVGGLDWGSGYSVQGYISNLRYSNIARSITVPTSPYTSDANTIILTCQSNRFVDKSSNAFAVTVNGTPSVQPSFSPFGATTQYNPTTNGGSAYFGTTTDYLTVPSSSNFAFGTGDFTVEAWLYPTSAPNAGGTFFIVGSTTNGFIFGYQNATSWGAASNGGSWFITSTTLPTLNAWNYISITRSSGTAYLFLNGTLLTSAASAQNFPAMSTYIGHPSTNLSVNGYLSNLRALQGTALYTTTFTPPTTPLTAITNTALLLNFTNAQIFGSAMTNNFITVGDAQVSTSIYKYGTGSIYLDGTGDWLSSPDNQTTAFGSGNFTVEGWIYLNNVSSTKGIIFGRGSNSFCLRVGQSYLGNVNGLGISRSGIADLEYCSFTFAISTWYHIAVVRSGTTIYFFVNGTQQTTQGSGGGSYTFAAPTSGFYIGCNNDTNEPYAGYIDELRITNGFARYTSNFTAPTSQFPSTGPIPIPTPNVEYLVVAGGGGGGWSNGGGGGAGGYRTNTGLSVTAGSAITVTIGTGGAGSGTGHGSDGTISVFGSITSSGGGGGGSAQSQGGPGNNGGSGGGGGNDYPRGTATAGGTGNSGGYTPAEGTAGGALQGGGGGASTAGSNGATNGVGGAGTYSSISGASVARGGGGGGSTESATDPVLGGVGGGGNGQKRNSTAPGNGTVNTGGGGGGGANSTGGTGGSGVVIIRYSNEYLPATSTTGSPSITNTGGYWIYAWTSSGSITF